MSTRKKTQRLKKASKRIDANSLGIPELTSPAATAAPLMRAHTTSYHWPLLLNDKETCDSLLAWFEKIEDDREMPWRKKWIDPADFSGGEEVLGTVLARRAYEVWVSEVMLQQTRVSTVVPYFKSWIAKWPTVQDLAKAEHDEVLAMWKGLGYYSRATRLHQGAKDMVHKNDKDCPIPSGAQALEEFSGIGRYTAGAISSIAFGEAEPVLDGNVARVLSRQLGLYVDAKDKKSSDFLWKVAARLVKHVAGVPETQKSCIPGSWNQAMMELGSTVCTPRPKCDECPIRKTCRAYAEGEMLARKSTENSTLPDIEDACDYCDSLDTENLGLIPEIEEDNQDSRATKKKKGSAKPTNTISHYFTSSTASIGSEARFDDPDGTAEPPQINGTKKRKAPSATPRSRSVATYCSLFPKKVVKKKVAEEDCVVCMVELRVEGCASKWLIEQRPAKGLLASLWQFPQTTLLASKAPASHGKSTAQNFVSNLDIGQIDMSNAKHVAELDPLVHVFSHLKLTMHVHTFTLDIDKHASFKQAFVGPPKRKWVNTDAMDAATLSTGMRRCWEFVNDSASYAPTP